MGSRLPYYITDYVTKNEWTLWTGRYVAWYVELNKKSVMKCTLIHASVRCVKMSQLIDSRHTNSLNSKSCQLGFVDLQHPDKIKRVLKTIKELRDTAENNRDSSDIQGRWLWIRCMGKLWTLCWRRITGVFCMIRNVLMLSECRLCVMCLTWSVVGLGHCVWQQSHTSNAANKLTQWLSHCRQHVPMQPLSTDIIYKKTANNLFNVV